MSAIKRFFQKRFLTPLLRMLQQGITSEKLALSVALGISLGIFPAIGTTTILCAMVGFSFRLNQPAIQLVNYLTYPLQLALFIPFFEMGAWLFRTDPLPFSLQEIFSLLATDPWSAIRSLWVANVRAIAAWIPVAAIATCVIYRILLPVFTRLAPQKASP